MARYEKGIGRHRRVWEITVDGAAFTIRYGSALADELERYRREHPTPADARRAAESLERQRMADGYKLVSPTPPAPPKLVHPLLAELQQRPDDEALWLVYADWLQSQGEPRGQLIVLQHQGLVAEAAAFIDEHREQLLGRLSPFSLPSVTCTWRQGFLHALRLSASDADKQVTVMHMLGALVQRPDAAFVESIAFGEPVYGEVTDYHDVLRALVDHAAELPRLAALAFGDHEADMPAEAFGDLAPLLAAYPRLERLSVYGDDIAVSAVAAPALRELDLTSRSLGARVVRTIADASWPALERLRLWIGVSSGGVGELATLLGGARVPQLRRLALGNCEVSDELCEALGDAPVVRQLAELELVGGTMSDRGALALLARRDWFGHLQRLDLRSNFLSDRACDELRALGIPQLELHPQRPAADERYVELGE